MVFEFKRHLIKVQGGRSYLPVSARIVWFRQEHPDWGIETEPIEINHEKQFAVFRARVYNAEGKLMAMGTKKEDVKGFPDWMEKAETGAVGRALALCGFGTQFSPELDEVGGGRFADSPQPTGGGGGGRYGGGSSSYGDSGGGGGDRNYGGGGRYGNAPSGGNSDGARFSPPREVSAPPPRAEAPRAEAARPAPIPAPPSLQDDGEDDFESLVSGEGILDATEDDPFGDGEIVAAKPAPAAKTEPTMIASNGTPACGNCGKALTKAQQELSIRNYGTALCPGCQKDKSRRPALAER